VSPQQNARDYEDEEHEAPNDDRPSTPATPGNVSWKLMIGICCRMFVCARCQSASPSGAHLDRLSAREAVA
jgi:hypothetical protein